MMSNTESSAYATTPEALALGLESDLKLGLLKSAIPARLEKWGLNRIEQKASKSPWLILLNQFKSPITYLLFIAAGLSFAFQEWLDGIAILVVILVNAAIGFVLEFKANKSMEALHQMSQVPAKVLREGRMEEISSEHVVPGDVLFLEAGDMVSADARLIGTTQFEVNESALTGESLPVSKQTGILPDNTTLAERLNMIFKGCFVTRGNAYALVTGTGMQTEFGKIATLVQEAKQSATPLEKKLEAFSQKLIWVTVGLCVLIFLTGFLNNQPVVLNLKTAIALAVAAIPEGLPIVTTLALASGMLRLARHNVIVKKLSAVESLGGTQVICTDKTGTLTQNNIEVNTLVFPGARAEVKPNPLVAELNFLNNPGQVQLKPAFQKLTACAALCNTANFQVIDGKGIEVGDPVEVGLLKFCLAAGTNIEKLRTQYVKVNEEPFSSETKIMGTLHQHQGKYTLYAKGAAEELIARCEFILTDEEIKSWSPEEKQTWLTQVELIAQGGLKTLAFAYQEVETADKISLQNLIFIGLTGLLDPPREEVKQALAECRSAGIAVKMITGDHPATAKNIAAQVGIGSADELLVLNGADMPDYSALTEKQRQDWHQTSIFARVSPKQKLDLVTLLQDKKLVVGMTGDGVNDAPALKKADIGIAMGLRGTQVAQEVADMILKDDSFASIVVAIKQGRIIYENIRKSVLYLLSCNLSELFLVTIISLSNFNFQLIPLQILFINLVTDVLPALALGVSPGNSQVMQQKPRDLAAPLLKHKHWISLITYAFVITVCVLGAVVFCHFYIYNQAGRDQAPYNKIVFFTLILCQLWHVFNMSPRSIAFYRNEVFRNYYSWAAFLISLGILSLAYYITPIATALQIQFLTQPDILVILGFSLLSFFLIQIMKKLNLVL